MWLGSSGFQLYIEACYLFHWSKCKIELTFLSLEINKTPNKVAIYFHIDLCILVVGILGYFFDNPSYGIQGPVCQEVK
jgi:hypothetical protein